MNLDNRVALVTGAGRGLGWGVALALARAGARVAVTDINDADVERAVAAISREGGSAVGRHLDAADGASFARVVDEIVERWGRLDALVHAAIYMPLAPLEEVEPASWERQLAVGLGGLYHGTRAVWEVMKRQGGGHIVGVASGSSVRGYHDEVAYCTIKHGQEGFAKALALEARPVIAINTVGPGAPIKPTRLTWDELEALPDETKRGWADPADLGRGFVWLISQPPARFSGLRFDAGVITATLDAEGDDFAFAVDKVTLYPDDFRARQAYMQSYTP